MNQKHLIVALLGVGGLALLYYLYKNPSSAVASNGSLVPDDSVNPSNSYPNSSPIKMGDINIGGSPVNLTYNSQPGGPSVGIGNPCSADSCGCGGGCDACTQATQATIYQTVPQSVIDSSLANLNSFLQKTGAA